MSEPYAVQVARQFHEAYERLAPSFGYETREDTKAFDPESANGRLMAAVCDEVAASLACEIETRFWAIVDRDEGMSVPSDMWEALNRITRAARNRDMWQGQCERQADELHRLRNEYICKCGQRVEPHRCRTGSEF